MLCLPVGVRRSWLKANLRLLSRLAGIAFCGEEAFAEDLCKNNTKDPPPICNYDVESYSYSFLNM